MKDARARQINDGVGLGWSG